MAAPLQQLYKNRSHLKGLQPIYKCRIGSVDHIDAMRMCVVDCDKRIDNRRKCDSTCSTEHAEHKSSNAQCYTGVFRLI